MPSPSVSSTQSPPQVPTASSWLPSQSQSPVGMTVHPQSKTAPGPLQTPHSSVTPSQSSKLSQSSKAASESNKNTSRISWSWSPFWKIWTWIWPEMGPAVVICMSKTRWSSPAKPGWVSAASKPGKGRYHAPPTLSSTVTLKPDASPSNSSEALMSPQIAEGCSPPVVSEPMVM